MVETRIAFLLQDSWTPYSRRAGVLPNTILYPQGDSTARFYNQSRSISQTTPSLSAGEIRVAENVALVGCHGQLGEQESLKTLL